MKLDNFQNIIEQAQKLGHTIEILSSVKSGKEASVYRVLLDNIVVAMKLYKDPEERAFKNTASYLDGKYYKSPSHQRAIMKGNKAGKRISYDNWVGREFFLLEKLYSLGARIPKPILRIENVLFMEYLGDEAHLAQRLCDIELTPEQLQKAFDTILETVQIFWDIGIIHADLSGYNILWWNDMIYVIDFPQAIDRRTHPDAQRLLERYIDNIVRFFRKYIEIDSENIKALFI